jgi:hypothetical protein
MGGICNVIKAGNERGHACKGYEIENDSTFEDFLGAIGFMESIKLGKSTNYEALQHWDTVCTSWIWVCADKSKRSIARPMGGIDRPFVRKGNQMVSRMCLVGSYLKTKRNLLVLEQPGTSLMHHHKRFENPPLG